MSKWIKTGEAKLAYHTPIFDVIKQPMKTPDGKDFEAIEVKASNWMSAVIFNKDTKKIVLVKEYRHGIGRDVYEFPSGTCEQNEDIETTCIREVAEETGYQNGKILKKLYTASPNPAFMTNTINAFLVEVTGDRAQQHLDADEFISIEEKTPEEVTQLIMNANDTSIMQKHAWVMAKNEIERLIG